MNKFLYCNKGNKDDDDDVDDDDDEVTFVAKAVFSVHVNVVLLDPFSCWSRRRFKFGSGFHHFLFKLKNL